MPPTPAMDSTAAGWLMDQLLSWGSGERSVRVGSVVPTGYPAYAYLRKQDVETMSRPQATELARILSGLTETPKSCWFAVWEGYGFIDLAKSTAPRFRIPQREYLLFHGPCDAAAEFFWTSQALVSDSRERRWAPSQCFHSPDIWWPNDHAWCVGSDTDLADAYIAGSTEVIERVVSHPKLAARKTAVDACVEDAA